MVENSLGRLVISGQCAADSEAERIEKEKAFAEKMGWKYYLPEAEQELDVRAQIQKLSTDPQSLTTIKVIDPCMGSGHILVYAFDVLIQIYEASGISQRDAAQQILKNNLYGLDIDDRAAQLAYFAVMMKARQYDRRIFTRGIQPHLYALQNSQPMHEEGWAYFGPEEPLAFRLWQAFTDAKTLGSLVPVDLTLDELAQLRNRLADMDAASTMGSLSTQAYIGQILDTFAPLLELAEILTQKYDVVITNPPYMGSSNMDKTLSDFVKKQYPDSKSDLFACFLEKCIAMTAENRYCTLVTMHSWMFLSSFENLRKNILKSQTIININHLGMEAFENIIGKVVSTTSFVLFNAAIPEYKLRGVRLVDYYDSKRHLKPSMFFNEENRYTACQSNFSKIPGSPVAYWVSENLLACFEVGCPLKIKGDTRQGMATSDNNRFLRIWHEVSIKKTIFDCSSAEEASKIEKEWFAYNKGGEFRKWYGNQDYVINYAHNGKEVKAYASQLYKSYSRTIKSEKEYFKPCLSWSKISSGNISFRYYPPGFIFDVAGCSIFYKSEYIMLFQLAFLNSNIAKSLLEVISPTLNYEAGQIASLPIIENDCFLSRVREIVLECIQLSANDWDSFEFSWNFSIAPLVTSWVQLSSNRIEIDKTHFPITNKLAEQYSMWKQVCNERFIKIKEDEEELNRIFFEIYSLQDELSPEVADKDITVHRIFDTEDEVSDNMKGSNYVRTKRDEIVSLISYSVGCMFGRYSLDVEGMAFAGGEWDASKYTTFIPDKDNIIPICDDDYFEDDITGRFVQWVEVVYGKETLEDNLTFIAEALGGKGTAREIIRNYFLKEFYKDHCHTYKKRPIYWLFDSGKKNGFKALIYMHRYQPDLLASMRTDYVHEQQERYRTQLGHIDDILPQATGSERVKLTKQQKKLQDQSLEIQQYEEKIHHLADQNIVIDLDDGVKHNYALFVNVLAKIK